MKTESDKYPKSLDSNNWYSNSLHEPVEITKNRFSSALEFLPQPSEIFVGIEELERRICDISPYISSLGNDVLVLE